MQTNSSNQGRDNIFLRANAFGVLLWERLWPLLVPFFIVASVFLVFSWLGGWRYLGGETSSVLYWLVRGAFAAGFLLSLWPLRNLKLPAKPEVTRHIEGVSKLEHRPITAQSDEMATGKDDDFASIMWAEHKRRMAGKLEDMTAGTPAPKADRFDPYALRAIVPLFVFAAFFFSFSSSGGRLGDYVSVPNLKTALPVRMDAWLEPPSYTRKPPIFLSTELRSANAAGSDGAGQAIRSVTVPEKSEFKLRFIGEGEVVVIVSGEEGELALQAAEQEAGKSQREFSALLESDSVISLKHKGKKLAEWGIALIPDQPPSISFVENPDAALSGSLQLTYNVEDDYGLKEGSAEVLSLESVDPEARPLIGPPEVTLSLPRTRGRKAIGRLNKNLTDHPWAGSDVSITLKVTDEAGQIGKTRTHEMELPGRRFSEPLARALVEQRRILALDANQRRYVADLLDAVSSAAPEYIEKPADVIAMRAAYRRLVDARTDDDLRSVLGLLWEIALGVEFGDLSDAERRLREAQEALQEALEEGASEEKIAELMQELREAMNEMLQALAEQQRQNADQQNPFGQQNTQQLTQNDLERMMDRIEDLARSGSPDAAKQLLSELQRMMDNLRSGRHEQQRQAEGNEFNQALDKLSELMQQQQQLMNESFRMQREQQERRNQQQGQQGQQNQGQQRQGQRQLGQQPGQQQGQQQGENSNQRGGQQGEQGQAGQQGQMTQEEFAEALRQLQEQQEALRQQLDQLGEQLDQLGVGRPDELGEAGEQMGRAGDNLGEGRPGSAGQNQSNALEALRQGAQNMMQQMAGDRQQGGQQQSQQGGEGQDGQFRSSDPLGRRSGSEGYNADSNVEVPGEIDAQRARRVLEAIRDRLAIPDNPLIEKDYLERLLNTE